MQWYNLLRVHKSGRPGKIDRLIIERHYMQKNTAVANGFLLLNNTQFSLTVGERSKIELRVMKVMC